MKLGKKNFSLLFIFLVILIIGGLNFHFARGEIETPKPSSVEGDLIFEVYPNGCINVISDLEFQQTVENGLESLPVYNVAFELSTSSPEVDITEFEGSFSVKPASLYAFLLSAVDLDVKAHVEGLLVDASVYFKLPGYILVNATLDVHTDESTLESTLNFDVIMEIWYSIISREQIELFVQNFPTLKYELEVQIANASSGSLILQELNLDDSHLGASSASLTVSGIISGDFEKGIMNLVSQTGFLEFDETMEDVSILEPEILGYAEIQSVDVHVTFDKEDVVFKIDYLGKLEGDFDKQVNAVKNRILEEVVQSSEELSEIQSILDFLSTMEVSMKNTNINFDYTLNGEKYSLWFYLDGFKLIPSDVNELLNALEYASRTPIPKLILYFVGASDEEYFVEIEVPPTTTEPIYEEPRRVGWSFDTLKNMDQITFHLREKPNLIPKVSQTEVTTGKSVDIEGTLTVGGKPLVSQKVDIIVNDEVVETVETDDEGGFSMIHKFEEAGSYQVKASFEYLGETVELPIATETVKKPSVFTPEVTTIAVVGVLLVAAAAFMMMKRR